MIWWTKSIFSYSECVYPYDTNDGDKSDKKTKTGEIQNLSNKEPSIENTTSAEQLTLTLENNRYENEKFEK